MEGMGQLLFSGPFQLKTEQTLSLVLLSHGQIRDILPSLVQPKILDGLTFSYDATQLKARLLFLFNISTNEPSV